jgi:voltage-gated potassium channel
MNRRYDLPGSTAPAPTPAPPLTTGRWRGLGTPAAADAAVLTRGEHDRLGVPPVVVGVRYVAPVVVGRCQVPILLARLSRLLRVRLPRWRLPLAVAVFVFLSSWPAMALVEPPDSGIAAPGTYWWYFVVTAATVGYGDVYPASTGGRLVGAYVIVGGIVTLTLLFTQLSAALQSVRGKRLRGLVDLDVADHVVLLGYTPGRTARIVAELTAENRAHVVLCAWDDDVSEDPLPERLDVEFVRGDLTSADVMTRACVARARTAVVDVRDDNEALAVALAVAHANPRIHLVAALRDLSRRNTLRYVHPDVQAVQWHMPYLLTEEATDPGIAQVYSDLMTSGGHGNTYSIRVPAGFPHRTFGDCQTWFGRTFGATVLALRSDGGPLVVSPGWDTAVPEEATLYYVAGHRIEPARLSGGR